MNVQDRMCPNCVPPRRLLAFQEAIYKDEKSTCRDTLSTEWICFKCGYYDSNSPNYVKMQPYLGAIGRHTLIGAHPDSLRILKEKAQKLYPDADLT